MSIITITSTKNPTMKALRALQQPKARQETGLFLAEGRKLAQEALRDASVQTLLVQAEKAEAYQALMDAAQEVILAPAHVLAYVGETKTPQGVVAVVRMPAPQDLDETHGAVLVLDGVQDPGNVGTMIRTAEAAGFSAVLLSPACADAFAPKVVRSTMGSVLRMPIWRGALPQALQILKKRGFERVASALGGEPFYKAMRRMRLPLALVIGSEGSGISEAVMAEMDIQVALPMRGRAESLNAAVAAGIMMYGLMENV